MNDDTVTEIQRLADMLEDMAGKRLAMFEAAEDRKSFKAYRDLILSEAYEECAALLRARALELASRRKP